MIALEEHRALLCRVSLAARAAAAAAAAPEAGPTRLSALIVTRGRARTRQAQSLTRRTELCEAPTSARGGVMGCSHPAATTSGPELAMGFEPHNAKKTWTAQASRTRVEGPSPAAADLEIGTIYCVRSKDGLEEVWILLQVWLLLGTWLCIHVHDVPRICLWLAKTTERRARHGIAAYWVTCFPSYLARTSPPGRVDSLVLVALGFRVEHSEFQMHAWKRKLWPASAALQRILSKLES